MKKDCISPKGVFEPKGWSHAIRAGKTIYLAGMGGFDEQQKVVEGGFEAQAVKALENMKLTLEAAGASFKDVVKITSYLINMNDLSKFREIRARYFSPPMPASTTVEVSRLLPGMLIEIEAVAVVD